MNNQIVLLLNTECDEGGDIRISSNSRTEADRRAEYAQRLQLLATYMY